MPITNLLVAIVDDEEPVRKALRRLLTSAGAAVETFASGPDFLASLESHQPDCLVLDLHLPGLPGRELQRLLAVAWPDLPVIIVTGKDEPGAREEILADGACGYLLKPLDDVILLAVLNAVSRSRATLGHSHPPLT